MNDLDAIRARHVPDKAHRVCLWELAPWPCDTAIVLAALDDANESWCRAHDATLRDYGAAIKREARLRAAIGDYTWFCTLRDEQGTCRRCGVTEGLMHTDECEAGRLRAALATDVGSPVSEYMKHSDITEAE